MCNSSYANKYIYVSNNGYTKACFLKNQHKNTFTFDILLKIKMKKIILFVYPKEKHLFINKIHDNIEYRWNIFIY